MGKISFFAQDRYFFTKLKFFSLKKKKILTNTSKNSNIISKLKEKLIFLASPLSCIAEIRSKEKAWVRSSSKLPCTFPSPLFHKISPGRGIIISGVWKVMSLNFSSCMLRLMRNCHLNEMMIMSVQITSSLLHFCLFLSTLLSPRFKLAI